MATDRINTGEPVVNGAAVVLDGDKKTRLYDNEQRTLHVPDTTGAVFAVVEDRYRYHGGDGGSGNWEH